MKQNALFDYIKKQKEEVLAFLTEIVHLESPTQENKHTDRCMSFIVKKFSELKVTYQCRPQKKTGN